MNPIQDEPEKLITDQEALETIEKIESEDSPAVAPEALSARPLSLDPLPPVMGSEERPVSQVTIGRIDQPAGSSQQTQPTPLESPVVSGPKKTSKLLIIILILVIVLVAGGTILYLQQTKSI